MGRTVMASEPGRPRDRERLPLPLTGEQETLVIPLYAKALDYRSRRSILHDAKADELVRSFDYDFERLRSPGNTRVLATRARQLDEWTRAFLAAHPDAAVLNLGCGLDTRVSRIGPAPSVRWFDVDFPDVIAVRRRFFAENDGYRMVGGSLTQSDWLGEVPAGRPAVVVGDGVFEYLDSVTVTELFRHILDRFPSGEFDFDIMNSFAARMGNDHLQQKTGARLRWPVDDLHQIDAIDPRLRRVETRATLASKYLPIGTRLAYGIAWLFPSMRGAMRLVRCEF